jgi:luciferase family oxidoreductase group 1
MPIRLSVLDFGLVNVKRGQTPLQSLRDTFAAAELADDLGYARFWVGEHHIHTQAYGSPQVMAAILATTTVRIRIGIGAMLLQYWSALKLAEDFRLLETLFLKRIDLGVGRGRADNMRSHHALLDGRGTAEQMMDETAYAAKLDDLVGFLQGTLPEDHRYRGAPVIPEVNVCPEIWVCGSGTAAVHAARTGTRFCCTLFHHRVAPPDLIARYLTDFRPSRGLEEPYPAIAVCGTCAETEAEAAAIREEFRRYPLYIPTVVGTPTQCRDTLDELRERYGTDEVVFLDMSLDRERRRRSMELLAAAHRLTEPEPRVAAVQ